MSQVYFGSDLISSLESKDFGFKDTTNKVKSTNVQDAIVEVAGKACNEVELTQAEYEELEKNGGVLADVNYYITDGEAGGGSGDGCKKIECTLAEYEEWEAAGTIDPTTLYFITDGDAGLNARTIVYNNTESGMTSGNVQDAIDELNAFDYDEYKANGFKVKHIDDCHCELHDRPVGLSPIPMTCKR